MYIIEKIPVNLVYEMLTERFKTQKFNEYIDVFFTPSRFYDFFEKYCPNEKWELWDRAEWLSYEYRSIKMNDKQVLDFIYGTYIISENEAWYVVAPCLHNRSV